MSNKQLVFEIPDDEHRENPIDRLLRSGFERFVQSLPMQSLLDLLMYAGHVGEKEETARAKASSCNLLYGHWKAHLTIRKDGERVFFDFDYPPKSHTAYDSQQSNLE